MHHLYLKVKISWDWST